MMRVEIISDDRGNATTALRRLPREVIVVSRARRLADQLSIKPIRAARRNQQQSSPANSQKQELFSSSQFPANRIETKFRWQESAHDCDDSRLPNRRTACAAHPRKSRSRSQRPYALDGDQLGGVPTGIPPKRPAERSSRADACRHSSQLALHRTATSSSLRNFWCRPIGPSSARPTRCAVRRSADNDGPRRGYASVPRMRCLSIQVANAMATGFSCRPDDPDSLSSTPFCSSCMPGGKLVDQMRLPFAIDHIGG